MDQTIARHFQFALTVHLFSVVFTVLTVYINYPLQWEKQCKALKTEAAGGGSHGPLIGPSNDIHNKMNSDYVNSFGKDNIHAVNANISNSVVPLQNYTNERSQIYDSELPATQGGCPHLHHSYAGLSCHPPVNGFVSHQSFLASLSFFPPF